jgi:3-hydroxyacyl-CoA dehydrogenase/enoyl-CoA hydratase/3-hydroxybutyryl-CoA epimerase
MIRTDIDSEGFATLTWDLPGRSQNVVNEASLHAFEAAVAAALADPAVKGVVITSAKAAFIAGADLAMIQRMAAADVSVERAVTEAGGLGRLLRRLETGGKPVVAAINGTALGGGLEIALACHHRLLTDDPSARVGLPEVTLGLLPGAGGTQRLPRLIGVAASLPLLLEGKRIKPAEALALGLVHAVVPAGGLVDAAKAWLRGKPAATQPWDRKGFELPGGDVESSAMRQLWAGANAMIQAKTLGNLPAPRAVLSCVYEGARLAIDKGLEVEVRYFVSLVREPTAVSLIRTTFFGVQAASKLARRPAGVPRLKAQRIGVLGAGLMGSGIAFVAATAGLEVVVIDRDEDTAAGAVRYAAERLEADVRKGRLTAEGRDAVLARIRPVSSYENLAGCDVVIEAVFEDREIKASVTAAADAVLADGAILASNTSTLPISGLAEATSRPEAFIGLHFFSPVEKMPLVEVIVGRRTSETTLAHALDLVAAMKKTPIVVADSRGFYTSRVFATYVGEGLAMLGEGVAPALIENAGRMAGMPMAPLALADDVGLNLMHQIRAATRADLGDAAPRHPSDAVLVKMVEALGRTGRRGGGGFYHDAPGGRRLWPGLGEAFPVAAAQPEVQALIDRFLVVQSVETARCMQEGLLAEAIDADVGALLGWGFAPWTGGPLSYVDRLGAAAFVALADRLADAHGERFRPPESLRQMAVEGRLFHPGPLGGGA